MPDHIHTIISRKLNVSIAICTYNRADSLKITLAEVVKQEYKSGYLEILVVDNCSKDDTRQIVESFVENSPYPLRYIYEATPGLSFARNRSVREAKGEIILFIDDDAMPESKFWAQNIAAVYKDPKVGAAGGDLEPEWPDEAGRPAWLPDFLLPPLGITNFPFKKQTELNYPVYPWGANISYRKKSVEAVGGFVTDLGWSSNGAMVAGEETELNLRLEKSGQRVLYVPGAVVFHCISREKLNMNWFLRRAAGQGLSDAEIDKKYLSAPKLAFTFLRKLANAIFYLAATSVLFLFRHPKLRLFCRYNLRFSGGYVLRILGAK